MPIEVTARVLDGRWRISIAGRFCWEIPLSKAKTEYDAITEFYLQVRNLWDIVKVIKEF